MIRRLTTKCLCADRVMKRLVHFTQGLALIVAVVSASSGQSAQSMNVKLLSPEQFTNVPKPIRAGLERMGCVIPQDESATQPNNFVAGEFAKKGQTDWAALCAKNGTMQVVVLWGGESACSSEPSDKKDPITNIWSQQRDEPPFATYVQTAKSERILELRKFFGDAHENQVTHSGVEYGGGNASVIYYCDSGKWVELQGDD
jgi:hypothetical protein